VFAGGLTEKQLERKAAVDLIEQLVASGHEVAEISAALREGGASRGLFQRPQVKGWLSQVNPDVPKKPAIVIEILKKKFKVA
jgi:hypothetical protein